MIVKAGVAQVGAIPFDPQASTEKAVEWIAKAGEAGCRIVVFPEAFVSGYPKGSDFDIAIGVRTLRGRDEFRRFSTARSRCPAPRRRGSARPRRRRNATS